MTKGLHVLAKFPALEKTPYNIITAKHWKIYMEGVVQNPTRHGSCWVEVARGTYKELEALAKLMPDPKRLDFELNYPDAHPTND